MKQSATQWHAIHGKTCRDRNPIGRASYNGGDCRSLGRGQGNEVRLQGRGGNRDRRWSCRRTARLVLPQATGRSRRATSAASYYIEQGRGEERQPTAQRGHSVTQAHPVWSGRGRLNSCCPYNEASMPRLQLQSASLPAARAATRRACATWRGTYEMDSLQEHCPENCGLLSVPCKARTTQQPVRFRPHARPIPQSKTGGKMRTRDEITAMVKSMEALRPRVRPFSGFGDDNLA